MATKNTKTRKTPTDKLPEHLAKLVKALKKGGTAFALAAKMKCSKPTAYARLRALREHGWVMKEERVREGAKGPEAVFYSVR